MDYGFIVRERTILEALTAKAEALAKLIRESLSSGSILSAGFNEEVWEERIRYALEIGKG